jgi:hypothetical protein
VLADMDEEPERWFPSASWGRLREGWLTHGAWRCVGEHSRADEGSGGGGGEWVMDSIGRRSLDMSRRGDEHGNK